uniref:Uncharacterized protein n=1 Tax=Rhizophora mucronata TaxID=61149 RepID=A0A2P2L923_RHIMU
MCAFFNCSFS